MEAAPFGAVFDVAWSRCPGGDDLDTEQLEALVGAAPVGAAIDLIRRYLHHLRVATLPWAP